MEARRLMIIVAIALSFGPISAYGQSLYGQRLASKDGKWLLPVATRILGSTDDDHVRRGSINSWDLSAAVGSPVWAAAPGVVQAAGCNLYESRQWARMQGYGCSVELSHGNGISSQYGHCAPNTIRVKRGDQVTQNTLLCQVGRTGVTSFDHTHFTILRNGSPIRIDSIFDINQMQRCHLCSGKNDPNAPVAAGAVQPGQQPTATGQQSATVAVQTRYAQLLRILAQYPPQVISLGIMGLLGLLVLVYWLGGKVERIAIIAGVSGMAGAAVIVWLFIPLSTPVQAGQPSTVSGNWQQAYQIVQGAEGWKCTNDGAYTMGGVTQGTYNRWRAKHGMGSADVCANLTREQAQQIFYEMFWLPVGADKMPWALGLTVVDHYYNTGKVSHLLAKCGQDVKCFNNARVMDYRSMKTCRLYCAGWINRVTKIRKYTER